MLSHRFHRASEAASFTCAISPVATIFKSHVANPYPVDELPRLQPSSHPPLALLPPPARRHQGREHRAALRTAYDARLDVFRRSGAILVEDDPTDPFHLCFAQYFPGKWSPLVVSSELFRSLAAGLGPIDSPRR